jgi:cephalosporin hydroxylase
MGEDIAITVPGAIVDDFHRLYYATEERTWRNTFWLGIPVQKCPLDLWVYQEILWELKPDLIVECGTYQGGSAAFLASVCDLIGQGDVITIDIEPRPDRPAHPRITYLSGSSTAPDIVLAVKSRAANAGTVVTILDSDHSRDHVLDELRCYGDVVTRGSYMIVEDTNVNGNPVLPEFGPGPMEAIDAFLEENSAYNVDESREKFYLTYNPRGFLRRT